MKAELGGEKPWIFSAVKSGLFASLLNCWLHCLRNSKLLLTPAEPGFLPKGFIQRPLKEIFGSVQLKVGPNPSVHSSVGCIVCAKADICFSSFPAYFKLRGSPYFDLSLRHQIKATETKWLGQWNENWKTLALVLSFTAYFRLTEKLTSVCFPSCKHCDCQPYWTKCCFGGIFFLSRNLFLSWSPQ